MGMCLLYIGTSRQATTLTLSQQTCSLRARSNAAEVRQQDQHPPGAPHARRRREFWSQRQSQHNMSDRQQQIRNYSIGCEQSAGTGWGRQKQQQHFGGPAHLLGKAPAAAVGPTLQRWKAETQPAAAGHQRISGGALTSSCLLDPASPQPLQQQLCRRTTWQGAGCCRTLKPADHAPRNLART